MTDTTRRLAQLTEQIARVVRLCSQLEALDQRATLLDAAARMFETIVLLVDEREPRDGALAVLALVRQLRQDVDTLSRQCEGELRFRSRGPAHTALDGQPAGGAVNGTSAPDAS